jgi:predicted CXXCH cytochrome family protein
MRLRKASGWTMSIASQVAFGGKKQVWGRLLGAGVCLALGVISSPAQKQPEAVEPPSVAWKEPAGGPPGEYTGVEKCRSCHKAETVEFLKTTHSKLTFPGKDYIQGCEVCHGPGKAHSDAVEAAHGDDAKIALSLTEHPIFAFRGTPSENADRCLSCHISSRQQEFFSHSEHAAHGLSCNQCHATHLVDEIKDQSKGELTYPQAYLFQVPKLADQVRWLHNSLLKEPEPALCFSCHGTIQAQFALPVHHRVPEGLMKCTDCHSPHGTFNRASLNKPNWETCVKCHVEKRGPYLYEHPAVKVEGCVICHNPHGSTNRMLLVRREGRQLCLQCHTAFHGQLGVPHGRLGFAPGGECVRCHVAVHGSNFDVNFLR